MPATLRDDRHLLRVLRPPLDMLWQGVFVSHVWPFAESQTTTAIPKDGRIDLLALRRRLNAYQRGPLDSRRGARGFASLTVKARPLRSLPLSP
jgi:hypothetical protein